MRRAPSIVTLQQIHDADHAAMRRILKMTRAELAQTDVGAARIRECFTPPQTYDVRMNCLNAAARMHGLEACESVGGEYAEYLNAGDSYAPTIIRWRGSYRVQSLGDFIETMERQGIRFN